MVLIQQEKIVNTANQNYASEIQYTVLFVKNCMFLNTR